MATATSSTYPAIPQFDYQAQKPHVKTVYIELNKTYSDSHELLVLDQGKLEGKYTLLKTDQCHLDYGVKVELSVLKAKAKEYTEYFDSWKTEENYCLDLKNALDTAVLYLEKKVEWINKNIDFSVIDEAQATCHTETISNYADLKEKAAKLQSIYATFSATLLRFQNCLGRFTTCTYTNKGEPLTYLQLASGGASSAIWGRSIVRPPEVVEEKKVEVKEEKKEEVEESKKT